MKTQLIALYSLCLIASVTWERIIGPKPKDFRKGDEWPSPGLVLTPTARCVASGQENTHPRGPYEWDCEQFSREGHDVTRNNPVRMYRTQNSSRLAVVRSMFSCIYTPLNTFSEIYPPKRVYDQINMGKSYDCITLIKPHKAS